MWFVAAWNSLDGKRVSNYGWFESLLITQLSKQISVFQRGEFNILLNLIDAYTTQPIGKWPKAKRKFARSALKLKFPNDVTARVLIDFKNLEERTWHWFITRIENVVITLNQNPNNYEMIKSIPPDD